MDEQKKIYNLLRLVNIPQIRLKLIGNILTPSNLVDDVLINISNNIWKIGGRFLDPSCGKGMFLIKIIEKLQMHHTSEEILKMIIGIDSDALCVKITKSIIALKLNVPKESLDGVIIQTDFLTYEFKGMKFDVVATNPPYKGKASLHQQFFNKGYELLKDGGSLAFIQPATTYFNKKGNMKPPVKLMVDIIKTNHCKVEIAPPSVFSGARIQNDLSITHLTKVKTTDTTIDEIKYRNGITYNNVPLEDISMTEVPPIIYSTIRKKYVAFIKDSGNMEDIITKDKNLLKASLPKIRGTTSQTSDFYTMVSKLDDNILALTKDTCADFGVYVEDVLHIPNVYDYLQSYVARFGLSMLKFSQNLLNKELKMIPIVDFSRKYTDEELYDMIGLTEEEINDIKGVIGNYYDR